MKPSERDELLARLDERTLNFWNEVKPDIKEIKEHLEKLNGSFLDHERKINKNRIIAVVALVLASGGASAPLWVSRLIGG